jgi:hypothetical protein
MWYIVYCNGLYVSYLNIGALMAEWSRTHQKVLILVEKGYPLKEIAEKVGMSERNIYYIMNKPLFIEKRNRINEKGVEVAQGIFTNHLAKAAAKIIELLEKGKPQDRLKFDAAREVLHQCGMKPIERTEVTKREYSNEEIESALAAAREVKSIIERLGQTKSRFLLDSLHKELPNESGTRDKPEPVPTGSADVPEKPVLPV